MDSSELRQALKIIDIMLMQQEDMAPHLERLRTLSSQNASGGKYLTEWAADTIDAQAARIATLEAALREVANLRVEGEPGNLRTITNQETTAAQIARRALGEE